MGSATEEIAIGDARATASRAAVRASDIPLVLKTAVMQAVLGKRRRGKFKDDELELELERESVEHLGSGFWAWRGWGRTRSSSRSKALRRV